MKSVSLDSGSIDMIVDSNDQYCFLEVNPVGQFEWVGTWSNNYIEKHIATFFSHETKKQAGN